MTPDDLYGTLIDAQPNRRGIDIYTWEKSFTPLSLTVLDEKSANQLKNLMDNVLNGFLTGVVLSNDIIIIWAVDQSAQIFFAVEEMVHEGEPTGLPKFQSFEPTLSIPKLGHPALVNAGKARIAGEIFFDQSEDLPIWAINRNSGRYGVHDSRTYTHLANVAARFRSFGMELAIVFP